MESFSKDLLLSFMPGYLKINRVDKLTVVGTEQGSRMRVDEQRTRRWSWDWIEIAFAALFLWLSAARHQN